jgi:ElaB/YqjD/DUF883 family membrane-anchored ribosome-binding protein
MEKHGVGIAASPRGSEEPKEGLARVTEEAVAVADRAANFARDKVEAVQTMAREKTEELTDWVRARPVTSILIAVGVGYLLGSLRRR